MMDTSKRRRGRYVGRQRDRYVGASTWSVRRSAGMIGTSERRR